MESPFPIPAFTALDARQAGLGSYAAPIWPPIAYAALVIVVIGGMLVLSHFAGERRRQPADRNLPYESGATPAGSARIRFHAQYYLVAVLFILFDIEAVFLFAWAIVFRWIGWTGFASIAVFVVALLLGLVYVWKEGALDWNRPGGGT